jgi:5-methylcytosine-specific restriction endonuclease McrA
MSKWLFKKLRGKKKKKKLLPSKVIFKKITETQKQRYYKYLKSNQWREKRRTALEFYGNRCGLCGSRYDLEIHHRDYDNIFKEKIEDLMILCETCHAKHHRDQKFKNGKESKYMRNPKYDTDPVTYYPKRSVNSNNDSVS